MNICRVKDILSKKPIETITVRTSIPDDIDMLFGYCAWDGTNLISLDGDTYDLDDEIYKYEFDENGDLTYWLVCEWNTIARGKTNE